jgi:hypothetical protein
MVLPDRIPADSLDAITGASQHGAIAMSDDREITSSPRESGAS